SQDLGYHAAYGCTSSAVFDSGLDGKFGLGVRPFISLGHGRDDVSSVIGQVQRRHGRIIDMPIDSTAFVPPAFPLTQVNSHHQHIIGPTFGGPGDIQKETRVATWVLSQKLPVQPDLAVAENTAKLQLKDFALVGFRNKKMFAIPAYFDRQ